MSDGLKHILFAEKGDGIPIKGPLGTTLGMLCEFAVTLRRIPTGTKLGAVADKVFGVQVFVTVTDIGGGRLVGVAVSIKGLKSRNGSRRVAEETRCAPCTIGGTGLVGGSMLTDKVLSLK